MMVSSEKIEISEPFSPILAGVQPETPEDASWSFQFINEQFAARSRKSRDCAEAYFTYVAQEIPKIDVEIAAKGHLWMETSERAKGTAYDDLEDKPSQSTKTAHS